MDVALKPLSDNWRILAAVEAKIGGQLGIDARSMAKQTGPLHLNIERLILANRYARAVKSGAVGDALWREPSWWRQGGSRQAYRPTRKATSASLPRRWKSPSPPSCLRMRVLGDAIQLLILDALTVQVLAARLDARTLEALTCPDTRRVQ